MTSVNSWYPEPVVMDGDGLEWGPIQWADEGTFADAGHTDPDENKRRFYTIAIRKGWSEHTDAASIAVLGVTRDLEIGLETRYRATSEDWTLCDRDGVPASVCERPPRDSGIPTARKAKFRQVLKRAHDLENRDERVDARHEGANEVRADGGVRESEQVDRAVREAATLIDAGDSTTVAINYVVDEHDLEHRRDDVHQRVRDRLEQVVVTDGGQCSSVTEQLSHKIAIVGLSQSERDHSLPQFSQTKDALTSPPETYFPVGAPSPSSQFGQTAIIGRLSNYYTVINLRPRYIGNLPHGDRLSQTDAELVTDGGRPEHRANCEDCSWTYRDTDLVDVSDEMERHARKEMHDVDLERAVATDGGQCVDATYRAIFLNRSQPQEHALIPIGRMLLSDSSRAAYVDSHLSHIPTTRFFLSNAVISKYKRGPSTFNSYINNWEIQQTPIPSLSRTLRADTDLPPTKSENSTGTEGGDRR